MCPLRNKVWPDVQSVQAKRKAKCWRIADIERRVVSSHEFARIDLLLWLCTPQPWSVRSSSCHFGHAMAQHTLGLESISSMRSEACWGQAWDQTSVKRLLLCAVWTFNAVDMVWQSRDPQSCCEREGNMQMARRPCQDAYECGEALKGSVSLSICWCFE